MRNEDYKKRDDMNMNMTYYLALCIKIDSTGNKDTLFQGERVISARLLEEEAIVLIVLL